MSIIEQCFIREIEKNASDYTNLLKRLGRQNIFTILGTGNDGSEVQLSNKQIKFLKQIENFERMHKVASGFDSYDEDEDEEEGVPTPIEDVISNSKNQGAVLKSNTSSLEPTYMGGNKSEDILKGLKSQNKILKASRFNTFDKTSSLYKLAMTGRIAMSGVRPLSELVKKTVRTAKPQHGILHRLGGMFRSPDAIKPVVRPKLIGDPGRTYNIPSYT